MKNLKAHRISVAFGHQKQKILQKLGSSEKSADGKFEEQRANWENLLKLLSSLDKELKRQKNGGFNLPVNTLADDIQSFFSEDLQEIGTLMKTLSSEVEEALAEYSSEQQELYNHVQEFLGKVSALKPKITERDNLKLDYDKWKSTVKSLQEKPPKDPSKLTQAEQKFDAYKEIFEKSNDSLIHEIADLCENKYAEFENIYQTQSPSFTTGLSRQQRAASMSIAKKTEPPVESSLPTPKVESSPTPKVESAPPTRPPKAENTTITPSKPQVKLQAMFDFDATESTELSFKEGDIITLLEKPPDSDWWKGELNGAIGLFPSNFVEPVVETKSNEEELRKKQEEEEKRKREEEEARLLEEKKKREEELKKKQQEEEAKRLEEAKKKQEEELKKKQQEEALKKKQQEEELKKKQQEEELKKRQQEEEAEAKRKKEEEELKKKQQQATKELEATSQSKTITLIAQFPFSATEDGELSFNEGDIITLIEKPPNSEWWKGSLNGKTGIFPSNYVTEAPTSASAPQSQSQGTQKAQRRVKAQFDFEPTEDNELRFSEGDVITVLESYEDSDWWKGEVDGRVGLFPRNYTVDL